ncbi:ATP-binding protein [Patescibacteria group bacterium]
MGNLDLIIKLILILTITTDIGLFLYIFLKKERGVIYNFLMIHILGILGWSTSVLIVLNYSNSFAAKLTFSFALIFGLFKLLFTKSFPENKLPLNLKNYWITIPAILILIITFIDGALFKDIEVIDGYYIVVTNGVYSGLYSLFITFLLIYPSFILFKKYKQGKYNSLIKKQLKYLFIGMTLFFIVILLTNSILPVFFNIYFFNGIGPSFSLILTGFIIFIISRYNFLNIKAVIQKGIIYTSLLALVVCFYLTMISLLGFIFLKTTQNTILLSAGLTTLLGIFGVPPLEKYFRRVTDKIFFKDRYHYSDALHELSEILNKNVEFQDIIDKSSEKLKEILKMNDLKFSFPAKEKFKKLSIPITLEGNIIGNMTLGEKLSGDNYTPKDIKLLETFGYQMGVSIKKAKLYEQAKKHSSELESKVIERTAKIQELQESQKQIFVDISHNLQTPLTIIKSKLDLLKKTVKNDELNLFERSLDDVSKFIYDMLRLVKTESGEDFEKKSFDFSSLLNELVEYFDILSKDKDILIKHSITPDIYIVGDKNKLEELITNLVSNAIKYISNEREIYINLKKIKNNIELVIEDTGIGIGEKYLPNIFNRFYRIKDDNNSIKGTGLGLAICKDIVEKHNGEIIVESKLGKGTKFVITFKN